MKYVSPALVFVFLLGMPAFAGPVKPPNVAGGFYPEDPKELSDEIDGHLAAAASAAAEGHVGVAVSPHAGYRFSGAVAAHVFKALRQKTYSTVVVLAPSHFNSFQGAAIWPAGGFQTPLGTISVDEEFAGRLLKASSVVQEMPKVFDGEHALEVELPFVQKTWGSAKIVPLLLGQPDFKMCEQLAVALRTVIGGRTDVLVLISSDMSHYHTYEQANQQDAGTLKAIVQLDLEGFWNGHVQRTMEMCGFVPVTVGLMLAKLQGLLPQVLAYANSGDTAGDKSRVVGYGAVIFSRASADLNAGQQEFLLALARRSVEAFVKGQELPEAQTQDARLKRVQGAFVTLMKNGQLRGCIGSVIGGQPLASTVRDMAVSAASQDPRFPPVDPSELADIDVEVSVLSVPARVKDASEIVLGRDGVIVSGEGERQGLFLPQVATETKWSREEFLSELCSQKAGLAPDCWRDPRINLYTFTAQVFGEKHP